MSIKIETPPVLSGAAEAQLRQVYVYLFRLSEHLNLALAQLESGSVTDTASADGGTAAVGTAAKTYNELRALIVNTAAIVRREMDTLETRLHGEYEAVSTQWGTFREEIDTVITETAHDVVREYGYDAAIETLESKTAGFETYRLKTEGFIRQGFVEYDDSGLPILGIAIGQDLSGSTVTIDGVAYEQFDKGQSCAFYTAEKVSFRINGQEVAYVSNRRLYIGDVDITGSAVLAGQWMLNAAKGFTLKWVGGDAV